MGIQLYESLRRQAIKAYLNTLYPVFLNRRVKAVSRKDRIEVVFFAMNLAMWRYQDVYDLLSEEERFNCHIVLTVPNSFTKEQQVLDLNQMREYFQNRRIKYLDYDESNSKAYDVKRLINPDILFYPQPYGGDMYPAEHDFSAFKDKLWCYIPYSLNVIKEADWLYDLYFHNLAWKIYRPLRSETETAIRVARNKGINNVTSGYLNIDRYILDEADDVWKIKDHVHKRLIWAPHFSIDTENAWLKGRANFLWLSQLMLDIAREYRDKLQIAFKPHPRLKSELYRCPDWGKDKTDLYYEQWSTMENTQLETGDFVDLFKTSDAMIHDSGSFTAEYLFVNKPVAFTSKNIEVLLEEHSEFGRAALNQHYIVGDAAEVRSFIDDVVLGGQDIMLAQRTEFFETVLKPNVTGSTSQFIVDDIKRSLGII